MIWDLDDESFELCICVNVIYVQWKLQSNLSLAATQKQGICDL